MTTAHLHDHLDATLLAQMIEQGYVKRQHHPSAELFIYNYTARTQFDRVWNDVTRACRGLITDFSGHVVARPFTKFFNHGEIADGGMPSGPVTVTDKLDGSLGILYPLGDGHAIATRGSFSSDQAVHATALFNERYAEVFRPDPAFTYLFEIIYPYNRIVVDYHGLDDLVLITAIETSTGRTVPLERARLGWPGPVVTEFAFEDLAEALAADPRPNAEGLVVHFTADDSRLKLKQDEYVRLHRLVTDVSERRVWEALSEDHDISSWLEAVPDEFYDFVTTCRDRLTGEHALLCAEVTERYAALVSSLPVGWTRKEFANAVSRITDWPLARALYLVLDDRPFEHLVWSALRPTEHVPLFSIGEDTN